MAAPRSVSRLAFRCGGSGSPAGGFRRELRRLAIRVSNCDSGKAQVGVSQSHCSQCWLPAFALFREGGRLEQGLVGTVANAGSLAVELFLNSDAAVRFALESKHFFSSAWRLTGKTGRLPTDILICKFLASVWGEFVA